MRTKYPILAGITILLLLLLSGWSAAAQTTSDYAIDWWTTGGGGGTSAAEGYSLSGSIGQADAGEMSGGGYTVTGGFWGDVVEQAAVQPYQSYLPMVKR